MIVTKYRAMPSVEGDVFGFVCFSEGEVREGMYLLLIEEKKAMTLKGGRISELSADHPLYQAVHHVIDHGEEFYHAVNRAVWGLCDYCLNQPKTAATELIMENLMDWLKTKLHKPGQCHCGATPTLSSIPEGLRYVCRCKRSSDFIDSHEFRGEKMACLYWNDLLA